MVPKSIHRNCLTVCQRQSSYQWASLCVERVLQGHGDQKEEGVKQGDVLAMISVREAQRKKERRKPLYTEIHYGGKSSALAQHSRKTRMEYFAIHNM